MTTRRNLFGLLAGAAISPVVAKLSPITTATEIGYLAPAAPSPAPLFSTFAMKGPLPGDLLWDEMDGSLFIVRSRSGGDVTAELQNNYRVEEGVPTPLTASTAHRSLQAYPQRTEAA